MVSPVSPGMERCSSLFICRVLRAEPKTHLRNIPTLATSPAPLEGSGWVPPRVRTTFCRSGMGLGTCQGAQHSTERPSARRDYPAGSPSIAPPWTIDLANDNKQTNKSSFGGHSAGEGIILLPSFPSPAQPNQLWVFLNPAGNHIRRRFTSKQLFPPHISALAQ